jgi:electron transport complex protein RnfC
MSNIDIVKRIRRGKNWRFHGGLHPEEHKDCSSQTPLKTLGIPPFLVIPLKQHSGKAGRLLVQVGDYVQKGQALTQGFHPMEVPVHASTSGHIVAIEPHTVAHPSGLSELCVHIKPDGLDTWRERTPWPDFQNHSAMELLERIQQAGVAGLGGAVFPTFAKLSAAREKVKVLIVNGAECEPYITADDRLMRDYAREVVEGIAICQHILRHELTVIAIEDNKPEAIAAFRTLDLPDSIMIRVIPTKYPSGSARQLIEILTGKQVPANGRSLSLGLVMVNVATVYAIQQAVVADEPLLQRVVTVTGSRFKTQGNAWVLLGASIRWLLAQFSLIPEFQQRVIIGGPMMGFTLPHADVPVVKMTNCVLAPDSAELPHQEEEQNCIRCGKCADVCPVNLLPQQLYWHSKAGEHEQAERYHLADCIECGACAWVCPSHIPLVHYYRQEKAEIQYLQEEEQQAERARQRFEAKKQRQEKEKQVREAAAAAKPTGPRVSVGMAGATGGDPIAAALARVKARQQQLAQEAAQQQSPTGEQQTAEAAPRTVERTGVESESIQAIRARRKQQALAHQAEKLAQADLNLNDEAPIDIATSETASTPRSSDTIDDPRKAAVAAAIARAKARKAVGETTPVSSKTGEKTDAVATTDDPRKAAVAAAIARAKARKAATAADTVVEPAAESSVDSANTSSHS